MSLSVCPRPMIKRANKCTSASVAFARPTEYKSLISGSSAADTSGSGSTTADLSASAKVNFLAH
eukprot:scaffold3183_cov120-Isochrysis_galbana.AAC.18